MSSRSIEDQGWPTPPIILRFSIEKRVVSLILNRSKAFWFIFKRNLSEARQNKSALIEDSHYRHLFVRVPSGNLKRDRA